MSQGAEHPPEKRVELILRQLEELPTLPAVAVRVLELTGSEEASSDEVVELISSDPVLASRILKLVHRSDMGVRTEVTNIDRAVLLLGFEAVRSAVLAVAVFQTFGGQQAAEPGKLGVRFSGEEFWKHSIAVACCAQLMAELLPGRGIESSEAFLCGLLHDLGKIALVTMLPKSFDRVVEAADLLRGNIADIERNVIGLDHMVVGKRLAERWQLPLSIRECAWLHGQEPTALPGTVRHPRLVNLITLADDVVREQHLGYSGNYTFPTTRASLLSAVGLTAEQLHSVRERLVADIEQRAQALGLGRSSGQELYQSALAQANRELGVFSEQLATKNRRLAIRAQFFDALAQFQSELRPDAPTQLVLQAIGQTAVGVLGVEAVAAFSLPPGQAYADVLLLDGTGQVFQTSLVDCASHPSAANAGGPVLSAGAELEWLVSAISPRLAQDQRYWICLEADGLCIGGVVWGAGRGEAQRLGAMARELVAISCGWSLALRTTQIREESRLLAEQLAETNRQLHSAQSQLLRTRTMVSVGELAAGAAHEMNNPLAVISGRSQLLARELSDVKLKHAATLIQQNAERLSQIITDLMDFAKPMPPKLVALDVSDLLGRALHEAKLELDPVDRKIELTMEEVPHVVVDREQVTAALKELIANATRATDQALGRIGIHAAYDPTSSRVVVTVTDNGCGMDEATLKHAFDPFFSSKPAGRRRGLGLPKALRWVETSGGSIRLESHLGQGTRATVLLPAVGATAAEPAETWKAAQ